MPHLDKGEGVGEILYISQDRALMMKTIRARRSSISCIGWRSLATVWCSCSWGGGVCLSQLVLAIADEGPSHATSSTSKILATMGL